MSDALAQVAQPSGRAGVPSKPAPTLAWHNWHNWHNPFLTLVVMVVTAAAAPPPGRKTAAAACASKVGPQVVPVVPLPANPRQCWFSDKPKVIRGCASYSPQPKSSA